MVSCLCALIALSIFHILQKNLEEVPEAIPDVPQQAYWFELHRTSNIEYLYRGVPGEKTESTLIKTFTVKTGIPGERPTPLPELVGRKYWKIVAKQPEMENPETAPYFITLDVPAPSVEPYGPVPYLECLDSPTAGADGQCNWVTFGYFGLHGTGGNSSKLSVEDPGSSGCIRHSDEDITYLYNLLEPDKEEIRYYVFDK